MVLRDAVLSRSAPVNGGKAGGEDGRGLTANLVRTVGRCGRVRQGDVESSWPQCVAAVAVMSVECRVFLFLILEDGDCRCRWQWRWLALSIAASAPLLLQPWFYPHKYLT